MNELQRVRSKKLASFQFLYQPYVDYVSLASSFEPQSSDTITIVTAPSTMTTAIPAPPPSLMARSSFSMRACLVICLVLSLFASVTGVATKHRRIRPRVRSAAVPLPHPRLGRGFAYSTEFRQLSLHLLNTGGTNTQAIRQAINAGVHPSFSSMRRWRLRRQAFGHLRRFVRQGNRRATVLRGRDAFHVAYYRVLYPKATAAELNAYLYTVTTPILRSPEQKTDLVCRRRAPPPRHTKLSTHETSSGGGTTGICRTRTASRTFVDVISSILMNVAFFWRQ